MNRYRDKVVQPTEFTFRDEMPDTHLTLTAAPVAWTVLLLKLVTAWWSKGYDSGQVTYTVPYCWGSSWNIDRSAERLRLVREALVDRTLQLSFRANLRYMDMDLLTYDDLHWLEKDGFLGVRRVWNANDPSEDICECDGLGCYSCEPYTDDDWWLD